MRYIWICVIDGCLIRSGRVQPGDTMPVLIERISRSLPHMGPNSIRVIGDDGRVYDSEAWFPSQAVTAETAETDDALVAVGIVEDFLGVKVHRGLTVEEVIQAEAHSFSDHITDHVDFGVFDFSGDQLASVEEMIALLEASEPEKVQTVAPPVVKKHHRARRRPMHRRTSRCGGPQRPRMPGPTGEHGKTSPPPSQPPPSRPAPSGGDSGT